MKFDHSVKYNGKWYSAGEEIQETEKTDKKVDDSEKKSKVRA